MLVSRGIVMIDEGGEPVFRNLKLDPRIPGSLNTSNASAKHELQFFVKEPFISQERLLRGQARSDSATHLAISCAE